MLASYKPKADQRFHKAAFMRLVERLSGDVDHIAPILLVVCGSAAAWMLKKVLNSRGGLFNRANRIIRLAPFTLKECEEYLESEFHLVLFQIRQGL